MASNGNKVCAIQHIPVPLNIVQVQSFLGMCGYYGQNIKEHQLIALPLNNFSKMSKPFAWTEARQIAFQEVKEKLTSAPVLPLPDYTEELLVYTEASFVGLSAASHQIQDIDGTLQEVAICFISRTSRGAGMRYAATQLECLEVVWALEKLQYDLDGSPFELITECAAVKFLLGMKTPNRHMFGWQLATQEYGGRMTISHRPESINPKADILSGCQWPNDSNTPAAVPEEGKVVI